MRRGVVLVAVALLAAACHDSDSRVTAPPPTHTARINGVSVVRELTSPPGSPLRNGLVVPEGTRLLGSVVPRPFFEGMKGPGWWGILAVTGSFPQVLRSLSSQLRKSGMAVTVSCEEPASCGLAGAGADGDITVAMYRAKQDGNRPAVSSMTMMFQDLPNPGIAGSSMVADPPAPRMPALPNVGEDLLPAYRPFDDKPGLLRTVVEPGTVAVGPPTYLGNSEVGAVVTTNENPRRVAAAYVARFRQGFGFEVGSSPVRTFHEGRTVVRKYSVGEPDVALLGIYVVDPPMGPTTLILDRYQR